MATAAAAAVTAAIFTRTAPPAAQPLEQLGKTTPPAAARKSASPAHTTSSGRTSGSPAARNVSAVWQGGAFPRRLRDNHARTSTTIYGYIFRSSSSAIQYRSPCRTAVQHRSSCRTVRHSPPSYLDIKRQR